MGVFQPLPLYVGGSIFSVALKKIVLISLRSFSKTRKLEREDKNAVFVSGNMIKCLVRFVYFLYYTL